MIYFVVSCVFVGVGSWLGIWVLQSTLDKGLSDLVDAVKKLSEEPEVNLPDETIAKLKVFAARSFSKQSDDPAQQYAAGLQDGTTAAAQYVLWTLDFGELKEEKADA
jgi:hypothetical protein